MLVNVGTNIEQWMMLVSGIDIIFISLVGKFFLYFLRAKPHRCLFITQDHKILANQIALLIKLHF